MHQSHSVRRTIISFGLALTISLLAIFIQNSDKKVAELKQAQAKITSSSEVPN